MLASVDIGWVAISRALPDHDVVGFGQPVKAADAKRGAFSKGEAWIDLICMARYGVGTERNKGVRMELAAGQMLKGYSWLASRWNWTLKQVRGFLDRLVKECMLSKHQPSVAEDAESPSSTPPQAGTETGNQRSNLVQVLTVCNYSTYQVAKEIDGLLEGQPKGNLRATSGQHLNKDNKDSSNELSTESAKPASPVEPVAKKAKAPTKGTLLPANWSLPDEWREKVKLKFGINDAFADREAERFARWWHSPDAKNRVKKDWETTWVNWIDRASQRGGSPASLFSGADKPKYMRSESDDFEAFRAASERRRATEHV